MNEITELDKYWNDFIYVLTGGNASEIAALKRYDIFDFFNYVENKMKKNG